MQLKLQRSQRTGGVIGNTAYFALDARAQLTNEEQINIRKYKLGGQILYSSEAAKRHADRGLAQGALGNALHSNTLMLKSIASFALARLHLNITVDSLQRGQHIECKDLEEVMGAEDALTESCQKLKAYLDTAATFDGREVLIDYSTPEPVVVSASAPVQLAAPPSLVSPTPPAALIAPPSDSHGATSRNQSAAEYGEYLPTQGQDVFMPAIVWWNARTREQRMALMAVGGLLMLYVLYHLA
jgi:hypothetical protein